MTTAMTDRAVSGGVLQLTGVSKRYGDTVALDRLTLEAHPGEILGVAGPNGAGKSTMVKILAAEVTADEGEILLDGVPWDPATHTDAVAVVHQEPQLFPNLTVAENLIVGNEGDGVVVRGLSPKERELLADLGIEAVADEPLGSLPLAVQQRTEIARSLAQDASVFLFDEPNSALTEEESADLFERMHALADAGMVVILVSHRLAELAEHTDRVAMIADGSCRVVLEGDALTEDRIARELVVGVSDAEVTEKQRLATEGEPVLAVEDWTHRNRTFADIDFEARAGVVTVVSGVEGSGGRQLVQSLAGFAPAGGRVVLRGQTVAPAEGFKTVAFVGAHRAESLFFNFSVGANLVSRIVDSLAGRLRALSRSRIRTAAGGLVEEFRVKTASVDDPIGSLSGGNQQKVAIAAAVATRPDVLILEEPTRGVDIGSKREIYRQLRRYAADGEAIVLFCTEDSEMFEVADTVVVIARGAISGTLDVHAYRDIESFAGDRAVLEAGGALTGSNDGQQEEHP